MEAVLTQVGGAHFRVEIIAWDYYFHPAAIENFVAPVKALTVAIHAGFGIRDQRHSVEPLGHNPLREVALTNDVSVLDG